MKRIVFAVLMALCLPAFSSAQGCPVKVELINPKWPTAPGNDVDPWGLYLFIRYSNASEKTVDAVRFSVSFADIINDSQPSVWNYTDERKVKPGKRKDAFWSDGVYAHNLGKTASALVTVTRVIFSDGTS
jgi:hypothetical protein